MSPPSPNQFPHCGVRVGLARGSQPLPTWEPEQLRKTAHPHQLNQTLGAGPAALGETSVCSLGRSALQDTRDSVWILEPRAGTQSALPLSNTAQATSVSEPL